MIIVNLDVELAKKKMRSGELAERIGITPANLSVLKTGKAKAIRFTTLDARLASTVPQTMAICVFETVSS